MSAKTAKIALALLSISALGVTALDLASQRAADVELDRFIARHPHIAVAGLSVSPFTGTITLSGIGARNGAASVSIETLRLAPARDWNGLIAEAWAEDGAKPAAAGSARADNVTIASGTTTYRVPHIELTGTSLTDTDLAKLLDPTSAQPIADRLRTINAASIVIPEVAADDTTAGSDRHWTEKQIVFANVVAGRAATGSAAGMSFAVKDGKSVINGTVGAIQASGLDLAQIASVFGTKRTDDGEPLVPLMDEITINQIKFANLTQNTAMSIATVRETGFKGRPFKTDMNAPDASDPKSEASKKLLEDVTHSLAVAGLEASDLSIENTDPSTKSAIKIASSAMQGFGDGKVGKMNLSGFRFANADATVAIGTAMIASFALSANVVDPQKRLPIIGKSEFGDIEVDSTTKSKGVGDPGHLKFAIKHVALESDAAPNQIPRNATFVVDHVVFDVPAESGQAVLRDIGYPQVDVSGRSESKYDVAAQDLDLKEISVDGVGMGSLKVGMHLSNVGQGVFSQNPKIVQASALAMIAKAIDIKLENRGLIDRVLAWRAKEDGLGLDEERDQTREFMTEQLGSMLGESENGKKIVAALGKFIAAPKTLHIGLVSEKGLGAADMALFATPDLLLEDLEVTATANE